MPPSQGRSAYHLPQLLLHRFEDHANLNLPLADNGLDLDFHLGRLCETIPQTITWRPLDVHQHVPLERLDDDGQDEIHDVRLETGGNGRCGSYRNTDLRIRLVWARLIVEMHLERCSTIRRKFLQHRFGQTECEP